MQPLSPLDAISPAFSRTRYLLLNDFHLGRFLKVALVAALAEGLSGGGGFNSGGPFRGAGAGSGHRPVMPVLTPEHMHLLFLVAGIAVAILIPLALGLMYLSSRFALVNFDMVLLQRPFVRPGWEALSRAGNRFFALRLLIGLAMLCVLVACFLTIFPGLEIGFHGGGWSHLIRTALIVAPFFLLYLLAMMLFKCFVATAVVPRMALEDASISQSITNAWRDLQPNIGGFLVYFLLRGAISLAIVMVSVFALILAVVIVGLVLAGIVFALYHFLWSGGLGGRAVVVLVGVLLGLVFLAAYLAALIGVAGFRNIFRQAYALLYYGGHYPALGNVIAPPVVPAPGQMPGYPAAPAFTPSPNMPPHPI